MRDITNLNIKYITPDGRYADLINSTMFHLTNEEILELRRYHKNNDIAKNRYINKDGVIVNKDNNKHKKKKYRLSREQKYNNRRYRLKRRLKVIGRTIIVSGLVICFVFGGKILFSTANEKSVEVLQDELLEELDNDDKKNYDVKDDIDEDEFAFVNEVEYQRMEMIQGICDIYQVDYRTIYNRLVELTDNFSNSDYLNGVIDGVTCKGEEVVANSEAELLVYAIRCMKQLPKQMRVSSEDLYINNGYVSSVDYCKQIKDAADLLGVDKCLIYAIVQSECEFDSELFNTINNPAGIKNTDGGWWTFDTKEEGFLELCMEVLKYYRIIGESPDVVNADVIAKIGAIHAPLSDTNDVQGLNKNWIQNVISNYEYAKMNEQELFGSYEQNNGHTF